MHRVSNIDDLNSISIEFWPIGQGGFTSINIKINKKSYNIVYDCGTNSSTRFLKKSIERYENKNKNENENEKKIDIMVISHFHEDHVNGFVCLAKKFDIKMLIIPAFDDVDFFINKKSRRFRNKIRNFASKFNINLLEISPLSIEEIIDYDGDFIRDLPDTDLKLITKADDFEEKNKNHRETSSGFRILISGIVIRFFNICPLEKKEILSIKTKCLKHYDIYKKSKTHKDLKELKKAHRKAYEELCKNKNINSDYNQFSTFFYMQHGFFGLLNYPNKLLYDTPSPQDRWDFHCGFSVLLTGDASIKTISDIEMLSRKIFWGKMRFNVFQVMHHGSRKSIPEKMDINIDHSVFCAGRNNSYGHPHAESIDFFRKKSKKIFTVLDANEGLIFDFYWDYSLIFGKIRDFVENFFQNTEFSEIFFDLKSKKLSINKEDYNAIEPTFAASVL
ncbi:MBL fold metallo-hydrolase [Roseomonas sp. GC11]|uniref:MBL fold metallo-hydrolase n=1 Tax=Roseomonas sp. GC11 TaxID=2950546 RepID=UPI00210D5D97|nr:MBL fold metallo-hydrolase [Roseomonas sp. GC11]MCQ4161878.1 MBL fold metallo-hydrolase [Roseomonas sp. GC11]